MKQLNLNRYSNPLMLTPVEKEIIAEYKLSQNDIYEEIFPPIANPDDYALSTLLLASDVTYNSVEDVIQALSQVEQNHSLSAEELKLQVAQIYAHMSDDIRTNRDDMMALTAYRPDAILWAPYEMVNHDFIREAIRYNPLVFHTAKECVPSMTPAIDTYRDVLFGEGPKVHPTLAEMGIQQKFVTLISPACDMDELCSSASYREAFKKVLLDQPGHTPYIDIDRQVVRTSPTMDFLVLCEQHTAQSVVGGPLSSLELEDYMDDRIAAYNAVKRELPNLAVRNSVVRENLAEFGYHAIAFQRKYEPFRESQKITPDTTWMAEYQKYQYKIQMHDSQRLYALNLYMQQDKQSPPGENGNTYPQSYIYEISELHGRMPLEAMNAQMNVAEFWQDVGRAVVDARIRRKENDYPSDLLWTKQSDRVFINEVKETIRDNVQKQFIRTQVNAGILQAQQEMHQSHAQRQEDGSQEIAHQRT